MYFKTIDFSKFSSIKVGVHLEVLSQAFAIMNQCYVLVCNSANDDMASSSTIIHPWGEVTMDDEVEVISETIDLREVKKTRRLIPMR